MPETCDGSEPLSPWRVGASLGGFATELDFGGGDDVALRESSVLALVSYQRTPDLSFQLGLGAVLGGTIGAHDGDVRPGVAASVGLSWLPLYEGERRPFVALSLSLSGSRTRAVSDDGELAALTASDLRAGVMAGKTFGPLTPYAALRGFFGPVGFRLGGQDVTGGDVHHYTVGAGAALRLGKRLELAAEAMPLGERSASLSASIGL